MSTTPKDPQEEMVEKAADMLAEHFDSVRIIVTKPSFESTGMISKGAGNFYAQRDSVREQFMRWDEQSRDQVREIQSRPEDAE